MTDIPAGLRKLGHIALRQPNADEYFCPKCGTTWDRQAILGSLEYNADPTTSPLLKECTYPGMRPDLWEAVVERPIQDELDAYLAKGCSYGIRKSIKALENTFAGGDTVPPRIAKMMDELDELAKAYFHSFHTTRKPETEMAEALKAEAEKQQRQAVVARETARLAYEVDKPADWHLDQKVGRSVSLPTFVMMMAPLDAAPCWCGSRTAGHEDHKDYCPSYLGA